MFCKSGTGTAVLPTVHKHKYIYLSTLKPCNILQAKNALGHRYNHAVHRLQPHICSTNRHVQQERTVRTVRLYSCFLYRQCASMNSALNLLDYVACRAEFLMGQVFSDVMSRKLAEGCRPFGGVQCVHLQGQAVREQ